MPPQFDSLIFSAFSGVFGLKMKRWEGPCLLAGAGNTPRLLARQAALI